MPDEASFINAYPVGDSPSWHPDLPAASLTRSTDGFGPLEASQSCPVVSSAWGRR